MQNIFHVMQKFLNLQKDLFLELLYHLNLKDFYKISILVCRNIHEINHKKNGGHLNYNI